MFKGFTENQKSNLEKINQQSEKFTFSFGDLELVEKNGNRRKCRIIDEELSNKLHRIYSEGKSVYVPRIKFIDFELKGCNVNYGLFPEEYLMPFNYS